MTLGSPVRTSQLPRLPLQVRLPPLLRLWLRRWLRLRQALTMPPSRLIPWTWLRLRLRLWLRQAAQTVLVSLRPQEAALTLLVSLRLWQVVVTASVTLLRRPLRLWLRLWLRLRLRLRHRQLQPAALSQSPSG